MAALPVYRREMPVLGLISQRISAGRSRVSSPARPCRLSANGGSLGRRGKRLLVPIKALKLCNCDYSINSRGVCQQKVLDFGNLFPHGRFQGAGGRKKAPKARFGAAGEDAERRGTGFQGFSTAGCLSPGTPLRRFPGRAGRLYSPKCAAAACLGLAGGRGAVGHPLPGTIRRSLAGRLRMTGGGLPGNGRGPAGTGASGRGPLQRKEKKMRRT